MIESNRKFPMLGKYLVRNYFLYLFLLATDFFINIARIHVPSTKIQADKVESILVCNGAHLGDVLLSTIILPGLRKKFPFAKIGFLSGSWSSEIIKLNPHVDEIHYLDHWKFYRGSKCRFMSFMAYWSSLISVVNKIRKSRYDLAIDLYYFYPNSSLLLWLSRIPTRVGYTSGGLGSLYTCPVDWVDDKEHVVDYFIYLASLLNISIDAADLPTLAGSIGAPKKFNCLPDCYVVIHPGASLISREWPITKWIELIKFFRLRDMRVVITGKGSREFDIAKKIIEGANWGKNLVNQVNVTELISVIKGASLLIGIESFSGHLAAALKTPFVVLKTGITSNQWAPYGDRGVVLTNQMPCSPCYQSNGCSNMLCIRGVMVQDVIAHSVTYLNLDPTVIKG